MVTEITQDTFQKEVLDHKGQVVLVDFYAVWCGPCKITTPLIEELAKEMKDVKFVSMDVDKNTELVTEKQIFSVPTFKLYFEGKEVGELVGAHPKENFIEAINKAKMHAA